MESYSAKRKDVQAGKDWIMKKYEGRDNDTKRIVITLIEDAMKAGSVRIEPQTGEAQIMVRRCKQADQPNSPAQKSNIEQ